MSSSYFSTTTLCLSRFNHSFQQDVPPIMSLKINYKENLNCSYIKKMLKDWYFVEIVVIREYAEKEQKKCDH